MSNPDFNFEKEWRDKEQVGVLDDEPLTIDDIDWEFCGGDLDNFFGYSDD